jgi:CheY-like chemotaxis protein
MIDEKTINLIIAITDSGIGIKQEDMQKLFGEYVQVDMEKNKGIEGTGLGLAITRSIVKAMDGKISVQSDYGKGSTFTITLPQGIYLDKPLAQVENPDSKNVLVYERRIIYADSIAYAINNLGVQYTWVTEDPEFRKAIAAGRYNFLFISFELYKKNRNAIAHFGAEAGIVILSEFGEVIPDTNLNILAMPAHCIPIAQVLNGAPDNYSYSGDGESIVRFTAPDATVLIVDDIITNLKVAKGLLLPYRMQVDICKSGAIAIDAIKGNRYDLVFMDHLMPDMDGMETTKHIRSLGMEDPYFAQVPVIALTANAVSGTREMFLNNGFNDFLSKPIDTIQLNAIIEKWVPKERRVY